MATFHLFPQLPLELRMQIWESAFADDRVLKIRRRHGVAGGQWWSPSPAPAVTRACWESRQYCSYKKVFAAGKSSRYIWAKLDSDIIQMLGSAMSELAGEERSERNEIRRLRVEMAVRKEMHTSDYWSDESESFLHEYSHRICDFPKLEGCDVLVAGDLSRWTSFIEETYWGVCPQSNVRIIDAKTGEWIDADTSGPYKDWIDTGRGQSRDYQRLIDYWDEADEEDIAKREEEMMKMQEGLPRIDMNP
jgi:hypothetical protein